MVRGCGSRVGVVKMCVESCRNLCGCTMLYHHCSFSPSCPATMCRPNRQKHHLNPFIQQPRYTRYTTLIHMSSDLGSGLRAGLVLYSNLSQNFSQNSSSPHLPSTQHPVPTHFPTATTTHQSNPQTRFQSTTRGINRVRTEQCPMRRFVTRCLQSAVWRRDRIVQINNMRKVWKEILYVLLRVPSPHL